MVYIGLLSVCYMKCCNVYGLCKPYGYIGTCRIERCMVHADLKGALFMQVMNHTRLRGLMRAMVHAGLNGACYMQACRVHGSFRHEGCLVHEGLKCSWFMPV